VADEREVQARDTTSNQPYSKSTLHPARLGASSEKGVAFPGPPCHPAGPGKKARNGKTALILELQNE